MLSAFGVLFIFLFLKVESELVRRLIGKLDNSNLALKGSQVGASSRFEADPDSIDPASSYYDTHKLCKLTVLNVYRSFECKSKIWSF